MHYTQHCVVDYTTIYIPIYNTILSQLPSYLTDLHQSKSLGRVFASVHIKIGETVITFAAPSTWIKQRIQLSLRRKKKEKGHAK